MLTANVVGGVLGMAMYIAIALMTQFAQLSTQRLRPRPERLHRRADPRATVGRAACSASRFLPALQRRLGRAPVLAFGCLVVGAGMVFFAATAETHLWQALVAMGIIGIGSG